MFLELSILIFNIIFSFTQSLKYFLEEIINYLIVIFFRLFDCLDTVCYILMITWNCWTAIYWIIVLIPKSRTCKDFKDVRSILSLSKILRKLFHLLSFNIFSVTQSGFRGGYSSFYRDGWYLKISVFQFLYTALILVYIS